MAPSASLHCSWRRTGGSGLAAADEFKIQQYVFYKERCCGAYWTNAFLEMGATAVEKPDAVGSPTAEK
jgi:hypothetical protein